MPRDFDTGRHAFLSTRLKALCPAQEPMFEELEPRQMLAADLALTSLVLGPAGPVTVGSVVAMTPTYRNVGNALSQASDLRIVLSRNAIYGDADDVEIFPAATGLSDNVAPLAAGAQLVGGALQARIPLVAPGQYRVIGHVAGATPDANTANDTFVLTTVLTVNGPASGPDLTFAPTFQAGLYGLGDWVTGHTNFANIGPGDVAPYAGPIFALYLSTDGIFGNADDIPLTDLDGEPFDSTPPAGYATDSGVGFAVPLTTPAGTYRVIAVVDPNSRVDEANEANNIFIPAASTIVVGRPDLQVTLTGNATVVAGGSFTGTLTARNIGTAPADDAPFLIRLVNGPMQYEVMFGSLARPAGLPQGSHALGIGQTITITGFQVPVPVTIPAGTYRVYVQTDFLFNVHETEAGELNNNSGPLGTVVVQASPGLIPLADLFPTGASVLPGNNSANRPFAMSMSLLNFGAQSASNPTVETWFSVNEVFGDADDRLISANAVAVGTLAPGGQYFGRVEQMLPPDISSGSYSIFVHMTAAPGDEALVNRSNNTLRIPITIQNPDLVGTISGPAAAVAGAFITPTINIRNAGTGASPFGSRNAVYLRPAAATDASLDVLLTSNYGSALAAGASVALTPLSIAIPAAAQSAAYRLVLVVDVDDNIEEGPAAESNTWLSGLITITNPGNPPGYDLTILLPAISHTFLPGQWIDTGAPAVANLGDPVTAPFDVDFYISTNNTFDPSDIHVSTTMTGDMTSGLTLRGLKSPILIPLWAPAGAYYLIGVVDTGGQITEYNEANNTSATPTASIIVVRPTISIAVMDGTATEVTPGSTPDGGAYRITRTGPLDDPLVVNYTVGGTASAGSDFMPLPMRVVIPAGQSSVLVPLTVGDDTAGEAPETVIVRLGLGAGYSINLASNTATITITDNEPRVTAAVVDGIGTEVAPGGAADGVRFSITRTGPTTSPLLVYVLWEGTASANDYDGEAPTFMIPAGQSTLTIPLSVVEDIYGEPAETLTMRVASGNGYAPGTVASANATINDNEPFVTVTAVDAAAAQTRFGEPVNTGQFRFTRTGPTTMPAQVFYIAGGTAVNDVDYVDAATGLPLMPFVEIPAGQSSALLTIAPVIHPIAAPVTVTMTVSDVPNTYLYRTAVPNTSATVTIANLPPINLYLAQFNFLLPMNSVYLYTSGQSLPITYRFTRDGLDLPVPAFTFQIRLSRNLTIGDGDDLVLMSINTPAGSGVFPLMVANIEWDTLPAILPGTYYIGSFIDTGGTVGEFNEIDNRDVAPTGIQFVASTAP